MVDTGIKGVVRFLILSDKKSLNLFSIGPKIKVVVIMKSQYMDALVWW